MAVYGQITYAPPVQPAPSNPIPTMSETMLLGMAIALAFIVFRISRQSHGGSHLKSLAAGSLALMVSLAGITFISDVNANGIIAYLSAANGGVTDIEYYGNEIHIINNSGKKQKILAITPVSPAVGPVSTGSYTPQCQVNDELEPNAPNNYCYVKFDLPPG